MNLTGKELFKFLDRLIIELEKHHIKIDLVIYGGAAIGFYFNNRVTRDIDTMPLTYESFKVIEKLAKQMSQKYEILDEDWINASIMGTFPPRDLDAKQYFCKNGINIKIASKPCLLATKAIVNRKKQKDLEDAALLFNDLKLKDEMDIENIVSKYYGSSNYGREQALFWEAIVEYANSMKKK